jgi:hypothetical protein
VKTKKTNNENRKSHKANSIPHCEDFQKMAEMEKTCCPGEGDVIDCCSIMKRMMGHDKGAEAKKTKETQKAPKCQENG